MSDWGFYGRSKDMDWLHSHLGLHMRMRVRGFNCLRITGRRMVGKSTLMEHVMRGVTDGTPHVHLEIDENWTDAGTAVKWMVREIRARGYAPLFAGHEYLLTDPDLPEFKSLPDATLPEKIFGDITAHLLVGGTVVTIDEFHRAPALRISSVLRRAVDRFKKNPGMACGTLVLTGSHEQMMKEMFGRSREWYGRSNGNLDLKPWNVRTVLGMAAERGLLERPDRFLTLWTAYGGVPGLWQRFLVEDRTGRLERYFSLPDAGAWRRDFIAGEATILSDNSDERFDAAAYVQFEKWGREAMLALGREASGTLHARDLVARLRERLPEADREGLGVDTLEEELGAIQRRMGCVRPVDEFLV